ncbi:glutamyl aminopeptidase-like [Uranotaenia lowii]|uniref:glutamyl aminopeptidase-like n=1 Tax=Uranotaenia lowii TaxID=190385 RepID=UPI0024797DE2|nr:glutamyl aminopeptidase-like [Uranotaenia lowii]
MFSLDPGSRNAPIPNNCVPEHYDLEYSFSGGSRGMDQASGLVAIHLSCSDSSSSVSLHWKRLLIVEDQASMQMKDGKNSSIGIKRFFYWQNSDTVTVHFDSTIEKGNKYILTIAFIKALNTEPIGLFRSYHYDQEVESISWMVMTSFYPNHARNAFPCFDEPHLKSTFSLKLTFDQQYSAVSNLKSLQNDSFDEDDPNRTSQKFTSEKPFAPFELAFSINEFNEIEESERLNPTIQGLTSNRFVELTDGISYASDILDFIGDTFGLEYPTTNLTLLTVPSMSEEYFGGPGLVGLPFVVSANSSEDHDYLVLQLSRSLLRHYILSKLKPTTWREMFIVEGLSWYFSTQVRDYMFPDRPTEKQYILKEHDPFNKITNLSEDQEDLNALLAIWSCRLRMPECAIGMTKFLTQGSPEHMKRPFLSKQLTFENDFLWSFNGTADPDVTGRIRKHISLDKTDFYPSLLEAVPALEEFLLMQDNRGMIFEFVLEKALTSSSQNDQHQLLDELFRSMEEADKRDILRKVAARIETKPDFDILSSLVERARETFVDTSILDQIIQIAKRSVDWRTLRYKEFLAAMKSV